MSPACTWLPCGRYSIAWCTPRSSRPGMRQLARGQRADGEHDGVEVGAQPVGVLRDRSGR